MATGYSGAGSGESSQHYDDGTITKTDDGTIMVSGNDGTRRGAAGHRAVAAMPMDLVPMIASSHRKPGAAPTSCGPRTRK